MKVFWASDYFAVGNQYGFSVHNKKTREALANYVEFSEDADIAVTVQCAYTYNPPPDKLNVLYWAWESTEIPAKDLEGLKKADVIIVSASYLVDVVKSYLPDTPVYLCHEGVDVSEYPFRQRRFPLPPRPFRWLWVGAPNVRKGFDVVLAAFKPFEGHKRIELYLKTTLVGDLRHYKNVWIDGRDISREDLLKLYHSAHGFVFPSLGEGFGLTCAEAMSTGLPVIYTAGTSLTDLLDEESGYPVSWEEVRLEYGDTPLPFCKPHTQEVHDHMVDIMTHYGSAIARGRVAAKRIRDQFTWDRTGQRIYEILQDVTTNAVVAC